MVGHSGRGCIVDLRPGTDATVNLARALDARALHEAPTDEPSFTETTLRRSGLGLVQAVCEAPVPLADKVLVLRAGRQRTLPAAEVVDVRRRVDGDGSRRKRLLSSPFPTSVLLQGARMSSETIPGSCLCGAVRFEVKPPFAAFRYCHCTRCQKASGSAHAANVQVPEAQFQWLAGAASVKRFDLPGAQRFAVSFCPQCGTRVPHKVKSTENMLVPAGVLDGDPGMRPQNSIFWKSKAAWYVPPADMPKFDEYP